MKPEHRIRFLSLCLLTIFAVMLSGCGGGGDSGSPSSTVSNTAPVANAGTDQNVSTGSLVPLDGSRSSDSNGDSLTYSWSIIQKPDGSLAQLTNASLVNPMLTPDKDGSYIVSLHVNDGKANSSADTVTITATTVNIAPVANAGLNQTVAIGTLVTLNGSGSSDANGDNLTYS